MNEELRTLLIKTIDQGLYQVIISNARKKDKLLKVKIRPVMLKGILMFQETIYREKKVFHENYQCDEMIQRIENYILQDFKQCEIEHTNIKATVLISKKGKITIKEKQSVRSLESEDERRRQISMEHNRVKQYVLKEGIPVPFLIDLGVQNSEGKVIRAKYDKYKQINRFLEFVEDILPALPKDREIRIVDFGCGKSYLTFAIYYYLHELMGLDVAITGLDLKADVIERCNKLRNKYDYRKLQFIKGDIAEYDGATNVDMVVTLHACDTATDYALAKAVKWEAGVILSVPCCQHEVNKQIECEKLQPILRYGIVKERISALITDALRADLLRTKGYETDLLEFIDMEHTPKNILIRAVKKEGISEKKKQEEAAKVSETADFFHLETTLQRLLK